MTFRLWRCLYQDLQPLFERFGDVGDIYLPKVLLIVLVDILIVCVNVRETPLYIWLLISLYSQGA